MDNLYFISTGKKCQRVIKSYKIIKLHCIEYRPSRSAELDKYDCDGYIFHDEKNKQSYSIQYPIAYYSQTSDRSDYVATEYHESEKQNSENEGNFRYDEYIYLPHMLKEIYDSIRNLKKLNNGFTELTPIINGVQRFDKTLHINVVEQLFTFFTYIVSILPENIGITISNHNMIKDKNSKPFYITKITVQQV